MNCKTEINTDKSEDVIDAPFFLIAALSYLRLLPRDHQLFNLQCFCFDSSVFQEGVSKGLITPFNEPEKYITRGIISTVVHLYRGRNLSDVTAGDLIDTLEETIQFK